MATHMEENAAFGIRTYSNYAHAFCLYLETWHALEKAQDALPGFQKILQSSPGSPIVLKSHLHRGFMTLKLIKMIPIDKMPELGMTAALWIPVQAYYAVHGFGLAALAAISRDGNLPPTHMEFLTVAENQLTRRLLPDPFCARLTGGFKGCKFMDFNASNLLGLKLDCEPDDWPSNLVLPDQQTRISHIARCLSTTRERQLQRKFSIEKKDKKIKMLFSARKKEIATKFSDTTVFDYLYRIRLHSNYQNPAMFDLGDEHKDIVLDFVKNNRKIADRLCRLLLRIIERRLRKDDYANLENECRSKVEWET